MDDLQTPSARLVLALNIEGVLVRQLSLLQEQQYPADYAELPWGAAWVQDHRGVIRLLQTVPEAIVELDEIAAMPGVQLVWNTPWSPWLLRVIEQAFGGRLSGGIDLAHETRHPGSPGERLLSWLTAIDNPPLVWADTSLARTHARVPGFRDAVGPTNRLFIAPDPEVGLTLDDTTAMHDWIGEVLGGAR